MKTVDVTLKKDTSDRSYPIFLERGILDKVGAEMKRRSFSGPVAVITNPLVGSLYADRLCAGLGASGFEAELIEMPDGEVYKSLAEASNIYDRLVERRFERESPIVALGGGVTGDMAGFVAATYLRGVPYIQVPTTLLSQVDSSIGGKTAVNHPKGKNLIGSFYQPGLVFIDPDVLSTLEERELKSGLAEVVKHAVIRDREYFTFLEDNAGPVLTLSDEIIEAVERSCKIKASVVSADEREQGLRAILNFGHTFGHAIEAVSGYGKLRHGEAVAIGMVMAARLSERLGLSDAAASERITSLLGAFGLPVAAPGLDAGEIFESMLLDKKVKDGALRFVLLKEIGEVTVDEVSYGEVKACLKEFF